MRWFRGREVRGCGREIVMATRVVYSEDEKFVC